MLFPQRLRDSERVFATHRHEALETLLREVAADAFDAALHTVRIRSRRPDHRPAARQDPRNLTQSQLRDPTVDESLPAVHHAHNLATPPGAPPDDGPDDGIQPRAISSAREDADAQPASGRRTSPAGSGR